MIVPYKGWLPDGELDPPDPDNWPHDDPEEDEVIEEEDDEGEENNHYQKYGYKL